MGQTSREIVRRCLAFETPERMPREVWALPAGRAANPDALDRLEATHPSDFAGPPAVYGPSSVREGDPFAVSQYIDEWGCVFVNIHAGVIGEVREPIIADIEDWKSVRPPYEMLPDNAAAARDTVNRACGESDKFMRVVNFARPWERYQFLRGTADAMMDMMDRDDDVRGLLDAIHSYYLKEMEFWASTDVDALYFMDDWGSQTSLLIPPPIWREVFKPMYKDYIDLAHAHGKAAFMHSDGHITAIYPDLVELGLDALNSQLFCMDMAELARVAKGKLTFWGEIDRQHVMPAKDPQAGRDAVRKVAEHLYDPAGGVIAQFEYGPSANPDVAFAVFEEWDAVQREARG